jgi:hypothetical protein
MNSLFATGVRPTMDKYFDNKAKEIRDYGDYWSASSAGYCMRKAIFERMKLPPIIQDEIANHRKQRIFSMGNVVHAWAQEITRETGVSVGQELELIDELLKVKGHLDDLILIDGRLIIYDYKSVNSKSFSWSKLKDYPMSYYHRMQLGTYMYMARKRGYSVNEGRILKISKDDMRMEEQQLMWSDKLEQEIIDYWFDLNRFWISGEIPPCTCAEHEGGFMAKANFNPYFYKDEPCSLEYFNKYIKGKKGKDNA